MKTVRELIVQLRVDLKYQNESVETVLDRTLHLLEWIAEETETIDEGVPIEWEDD